MPASALSGRQWPPAPIGRADVLSPIAAELAQGDARRHDDSMAELGRLSGALVSDLRRHARAPGRSEGRRQIQRLQQAAATLVEAAACLHPSLAPLLGHPHEDAALVGRAIADRAGALLAELAREDLARPGPGSFAQMMWGDPRLRLCRGAARLVIAQRGDSCCSSTPGGLLYRVAAAVWEHAVAEDAECFGLDRYVLQAAALERASLRGLHQDLHVERRSCSSTRAENRAV